MLYLCICAVHGQNDHSDLVINVVPQHKKPAQVDIVASQTLANAKTAEEYVNRAIEMRNRYDTTPSSSFVKYDMYENLESKQHPHQHLQHLQHQHQQQQASPTPASQIEEPIPKKAVTEVSKKYDYDADDFRRPDFLKQLNFGHKDQEPAYSSFHDTYLPEAFDLYQEDKSHLFKKKVPPSTLNYPSKDEVLGTIEKSVLKYMQQLEADGRFFNVGGGNRPTAHTEIKTYYRFPTGNGPNGPVGPIGPTSLPTLLPQALSTPLPSQTTSNIISTGTHSEFFKSPKGGLTKSKYSTIKPFTADTYLPDTIDLTFPSNKKRPKPVDLAALDVGQTWLHTNEPPPRKPNPKPKLHFNSQSYQDINSLTYPPNKGLFDDDNVPYSSGTWSEQVNAHTRLKPLHHDGSANVGASISFGGNQDPYGASDESLKAAPGHYVPSVQVLNGVAVSNPYKYHLDTLK